MSRKADVPSFTVTYGEGALALVHQLRVRPPLRNLELVGTVVRCMGVSRGMTSLIDIDLASGEEVRRVGGLSSFHNIQYLPSGWGIATKRTSRVGEGPTELWFVDPEGSVAAESEVPDAVSEIVPGNGVWYIGCRDGFLYTYSPEGHPSWTWQTPGSERYNGSPYLRPCPYFVTFTGQLVVVASMDNIYAIADKARTAWHYRIPKKKRAKSRISMPCSTGPSPQQAYKALGIRQDASAQEVRSAYRRLAFATHPDRSPEDPGAPDKFRRVQSAYEAITSGIAPESGPLIEFVVDLVGGGPKVSFLAANGSGVVAGSSQGRIYRLNGDGGLVETATLGDTFVTAALRTDNSLGAAWCEGNVNFFRGNEVMNSIPVHGFPRRMTMLGQRLLLQDRNRLELIDGLGQSLWVAEFSRTVSSVAVCGRNLICAAGSLVTFRDSSPGARVQHPGRKVLPLGDISSFRDEPSQRVIEEPQVEVLELSATYLDATGKKALMLDGEEPVSVEKFVSRYFERQGFQVLSTENAPLHVLFGVYMWPLIQDPEDPRSRRIGFGNRHGFDGTEQSEIIWTLLPEDFGKSTYGRRRRAAIEEHRAAVVALLAGLQRGVSALVLARHGLVEGFAHHSGRRWPAGGAEAHAAAGESLPDQALVHPRVGVRVGHDESVAGIQESRVAGLERRMASLESDLQQMERDFEVSIARLEGEQAPARGAIRQDDWPTPPRHAAIRRPQ